MIHSKSPENKVVKLKWYLNWDHLSGFTMEGEKKICKLFIACKLTEQVITWHIKFYKYY